MILAQLPSAHKCIRCVYYIMCRMLLTRYLAETGEESKLSGVIALSGLWDSIVSSSGLEQFPNRQLYNWYLASSLRQIVKRWVILDCYSGV